MTIKSNFQVLFLWYLLNCQWWEFYFFCCCCFHLFWFWLYWYCCIVIVPNKIINISDLLIFSNKTHKYWKIKKLSIFKQVYAYKSALAAGLFLMRQTKWMQLKHNFPSSSVLHPIWKHCFSIIINKNVNTLKWLIFLKKKKKKKNAYNLHSNHTPCTMPTLIPHYTRLVVILVTHIPLIHIFRSAHVRTH